MIGELGKVGDTGAIAIDGHQDGVHLARQQLARCFGLVALLGQSVERIAHPPHLRRKTTTGADQRRVNGLSGQNLLDGPCAAIELFKRATKRLQRRRMLHAPIVKPEAGPPSAQCRHERIKVVVRDELAGQLKLDDRTPARERAAFRDIAAATDHRQAFCRRTAEQISLAQHRFDAVTLFGTRFDAGETVRRSQDQPVDADQGCGSSET